jgi:hypothetical protein
VRRFEHEGGELMAGRSITRAYFVQLYGEHGYALANAPAEP